MYAYAGPYERSYIQSVGPGVAFSWATLPSPPLPSPGTSPAFAPIDHRSRQCNIQDAMSNDWKNDTEKHKRVFEPFRVCAELGCAVAKVANLSSLDFAIKKLNHTHDAEYEVTIRGFDKIYDWSHTTIVKVAYDEQANTTIISWKTGKYSYVRYPSEAVDEAARVLGTELASSFHDHVKAEQDARDAM